MILTSTHLRRAVLVVASTAALLAAAPVASASVYGAGAYRGAQDQSQNLSTPLVSRTQSHYGTKGHHVLAAGHKVASSGATPTGRLAVAPATGSGSGVNTTVVAAALAGIVAIVLIAAYLLRDLLPRRRALRTS